MIVELNLTQLIFLFIAAASGLWAVAKVLATLFLRDQKKKLADIQSWDQAQHALMNEQFGKFNARFETLSTAIKDEAGQWARVERDLLTFKADLPLHYVRREDYIRGQTVMEAKQDALYSRIDLLQNQIQALISKGVSPHG